MVLFAIKAHLRESINNNLCEESYSFWRVKADITLGKFAERNNLDFKSLVLLIAVAYTPKVAAAELRVDEDRTENYTRTMMNVSE